MSEKPDGKKKLILIAVLAVVIIIGIVLIATDKPSDSDGSAAAPSGLAAALFSGYLDDEPAYSSDFYTGTGSNGFSGSTSYSSQCFWCNDTGKCPECRGLKDCQYKYGASHPCVNGKIYYGGDTILCTACGGTGDCSKCYGTGRCPYCR